MAASNQQHKTDVLIALLGMTGAGKSTFARHASGDQTLRVGNSIYPCTQDPQLVLFNLGDHRIFLIDTPGFDDDNRSDVEILEHIAKWMDNHEVLRGSQLDGLILLHPVTMHRLGGNERRRTRLLQNLLGANAHQRIIIATTMWGRLKDENDVATGVEERKMDIWHDLLSNGATYMRHDNNRESAHKIITEIINLSRRHGKLEPLIKTELAKDARLVRTTAGKSVKKDLESDLERAKALLREHIEAEPQNPGKSDYDTYEKWRGEHQEWLDERKSRRERVKRLEARLAKLKKTKVKRSSFLATCSVM